MAVHEYGLVLRGHIMRSGGQGVFNADGSGEDLKLVLHSVRKNASSPSTSILFVAVDVVWLNCTGEQAEEFRGFVRRYLNFPGSSVFIRVHHENLGATQTSSLLRTLDWVRPYANSLGQGHSILFLRCDCVLKSYFQIDDWLGAMNRQDQHGRAMLFPFKVFEEGGPADQIFLLPKELWGHFEKGLQYLSTRKPGSLHAKSLHFLHTRKCMGSKVVYFMDVVADANTAKEWNPFYVMLGRSSKLRDVSCVKWDAVLEVHRVQVNAVRTRSQSTIPFRTCDYCWRYTRTMACADCKSWACEKCNYWCSLKANGCGAILCLECNRKTDFISEIRPRLWKCRSCVDRESGRCYKQRKTR